MTLHVPPDLADPGVKAFRDGTHRLIAPAQTIARVRPFLPLMGITRIANVTGLDVIDVPVVTVMRPNSRSLSVSQGKGLTLDAARASGLMESVEGYHAENIDRPLKLATYDAMRHAHPTVDASGLPLHRGSLFHPDYRLLWIEGWDLLAGGPKWVPFELVHTDFTLPMPSGAGCFLPSSNGLASGNHLLEATSHAICEIVERDATTLWNLRSPEEQRPTRVDLDSIDDRDCRWVLDRYAAAGVRVAVWDMTSDVGLPVFKCTITEGADTPFRRLPSASGMGCHATRRIALLRALTEAAQSRLTLIAGSRDDTTRRVYDHTMQPDVLRSVAGVVDEGAARRFDAAPDHEGASFAEDVSWELERLAAVGVREVVLVDLTKRELGIPVARVIVPGLEACDLAPGYLPGARAQQRGGLQ